ncbi:MAG: UDP-N-acetylmuramate--L-alanine ligase [Anaerolineales bacterium]|nr:UDP-N-acetylmuramate--L-alanine ligase [Anaerolineales bacterium]
MKGSVHIVGIGGAGMSAIAKVLVGRGQKVTGSDQNQSIYTESLEALGVEVQIGHRESNLVDAGIVLASSAVPDGNVELTEARKRGIPVMRRREFWHELLSGKRTVAVAGTHGKTTTTGLIAWMLDHAGREPSFIVGGLLMDFDTNARAGEGDVFVVEADEYDRAFHGMDPEIAVITNVEHDHPDSYPTFDSFKQAFETFARSATGTVILCEDDPVAAAMPVQDAQRVGYGLTGASDWSAADIRPNSAGGSDFLVLRSGETLGLVRSRLLGRHNVQNALAAFAAVDVLDLEFNEAREALTQYRGVRRRFEVIGERAGITVVDDYAHHPTEIVATLQSARERYPQGNLWAVFQPHTYSRLKALEEAFREAFGSADRVLVMDVFAARETTNSVISGEMIAANIDHPNVRYSGDIAQTVDLLGRGVMAGDVVITLSAGDGNQVGRLLLEKIKASEGETDHG